MLDWKKIKQVNKSIPAFLVGIFQIDDYRNINSISIKIWERADSNFPYLGECEYAFWGPDQADPYKSTNPSKSIEAAFNEALAGITFYDSEKFPNDVVFFEKNGTYIDGNGKEVTLTEIQNRIKKYRQKNNS